MNIKKSVKEVAHRLDVNLTEFADMCQMNQSQLSQIFASGDCSSKILRRFATAGDMTVSEFVRLGE